MKLSMWMIVNQVSELDIKTEIRHNAPAILNSARLAYATNCVHVYQERDHVVCDGEGDRICFYGMETIRVFELIQSIFDAHEDWLAGVRDAAVRQDYQGVMDAAYRMFKNPMVLFDANNKVLGLTRAYGEHELDREWEYLYRYGYSSVNAMSRMKESAGDEFFTQDRLSFFYPKNSQIELGGISSGIFFNGVFCGRINLMAKERRLNEGDVQLLQLLAETLQPTMGQTLMQDLTGEVNDVFLNLALNQPYDRSRLEMQLKYHGWAADGVYYVTLIRFPEKEETGYTERLLNSVMRMLLQNLQNVSVNRWKNDCILVSDRNLEQDYDSCTVLRNLVVNNPVKIGFSLPDHGGITEIARFYRQAKYALERGTEKQKAFHHFESCAVEFLLLSRAEREDKIAACMPAALKLWKDRKEGDEMFRTLLCFLDHERSIAQAAAELFLHRNTMVYRVKKIQESLDLDLDNAEVRRYCHLSLQFLEACEQAGR